MTRSFQSAALKGSAEVRAGVRGALSPSWKKVEYLVCAFGPSPFSVIHLRIIHHFSQCMCRKGERVQPGLELSPCRKKSTRVKKKKREEEKTEEAETLRSCAAPRRSLRCAHLREKRVCAGELAHNRCHTGQSRLQYINKYMHSTRSSLCSAISKHKAVCAATCEKLETSVGGTAVGL